MRTQRSKFIGSFTFGLCFILLWLGGASGDGRAQSADACGPAPAVKAALGQLPEQTPAQTDWQFHEQHAAALHALLRQYPDDVFVQRAYINSMGSRSDKDKVIAEYKARYERNPNNPRAAYLYGLTLIGRQSPEAIKLFSAALKKDPKFERPHLDLVTIYNSPVFLNKEQSAASLRAFLDACPDSLDGYDPLTRMDDKDLLRPYAAQLRTLLASRSDSDAVGAYRTLWAIEFKAHPASDYDGLRKQVGQDIDRLRQLKLEDRRQWYEALEGGYKLINDQKQSDWAQEQAQTRFPRPWELPAMTKWWKDHHWPGEDATPDTKRAFYSDLLQQSSQWVKERPNTVFVWYYRLEAMEELDDVPAADVEAATNLTLKSAVDNAGPDGPSSNVYFNGAEVLSKKHVEPERVVEFAQKGLAQKEIESKEPFNDLYATKEEPWTATSLVRPSHVFPCWNSRWTVTCNRSRRQGPALADADGRVAPRPQVARGRHSASQEILCRQALGLLEADGARSGTPADTNSMRWGLRECATYAPRCPAEARDRKEG